MPSRPVLIGRGLVPHPHTNKTSTQLRHQVSRVHYPTPNNHVHNQHKHANHTQHPTPTRANLGSQSYGGHSDRETPGPIPNPEVKPSSADGTAPEREWESRTPPNNFHTSRGHPSGGLCCVEGSDWPTTGSPDSTAPNSTETDEPEKVDPRGRRTTQPPAGPPAVGPAAGPGVGPPAARAARRAGPPAAPAAPAVRGATAGTSPRGQSRDQRGARTGSRAPRSGDWSRPREEQRPRTTDQATYDGPPIPEEITGAELDRSVTAQLKGLPEKLAARVARHLAAAGMLIDTDPETAYQHTLAARARASRLAVVREATGEAAYAAGHYAEALAELRAAKRMNGATAYLPIMADCHRALGHPEQAHQAGQEPVGGQLPVRGQGRDDHRRGRRPPRHGSAGRGAAHPGAGPADVQEP